MRRATYLHKEELLHGKVIMQLRAKVLGRETLVWCLLQNADVGLMSKQGFVHKRPFLLSLRKDL